MTHSNLSTFDAFKLALKWTARAAGATSFGVLALFVVSHIGAGEFKPDLPDSLGLLCFPGGVMLGLALAFRFEKAGAVTAISSSAAFYVYHVIRSGTLPRGPYFLFFVSPAILFLISAWLSQPRSQSSNSPAESRSQ